MKKIKKKIDKQNPRYCPICKDLLGEHDCKKCDWCGTSGNDND